MGEEDKTIELMRTRNYLANQRTFLSWIRTSLGVMAFGFVVEKFALFIQEIAVVISKRDVSRAVQSSEIHASGASYFGILLVGFGALIGLIAFIQYERTRRRIEQGVFYRSAALARVLTGAILAIGVFLIAYLLIS